MLFYQVSRGFIALYIFVLHHSTTVAQLEYEQFEVDDEDGLEWDKSATVSLKYIVENLIEAEDDYVLLLHSYVTYENDAHFETQKVKLFFSNVTCYRNCSHWNMDPNKPRHFHRFRKPVFFLLGPWHSVSVINVLDFFIPWNFRHSNLIVFSDTGKHKPHKDLQSELRNTPALKLKILLKNNSLQIVLLQSQQENTINISKLMQTPALLHKALFWNGKGSKVLSGLSFRSNYILQLTGGNLFLCFLWLQQRSDLFANCDRVAMETIYLAQAHNFTLDVFDKGQQEKSINEYTEYIQTPVIHFGYSYISYSEFDGLTFSRHVHQKVVYCKKVDKSEEDSIVISIWILAFSPGVWVCLLVSNLGILMLFYQRQDARPLERLMSSVTGHVSLILGQSPSLTFEKRITFSLLILSSILSVFLGGCYQNGIASLVTAPEPPRIYKTVREMIDADYKILWFSPDYKDGITPGTFHKFYFKTRHIEHLLNTSFYQVNKFYSYDLAAHFLQRKFSSTFNHELALIMKEFMARTINRNVDAESQRQCHVVPEAFKEMPIFWLFDTIYRYWLARSILRIHQSGLTLHTESINDLYYRLLLDPPFIETKIQLPDLITFGKLGGLAPFCIFVEFLALLTFIFEVWRGGKLRFCLPSNIIKLFIIKWDYLSGKKSSSNQAKSHQLTKDQSASNATQDIKVNPRANDKRQKRVDIVLDTLGELKSIN